MTSETVELPVSMMEAYTMGIPVVATAVGGIPEMVQDGKNGYLLSVVAGIEEFVTIIERCYALTVEQKKQMSRAVLDTWHENDSASVNAEKLVRILDEL